MQSFSGKPFKPMTDAEAKHQTRPMSHAEILEETGGYKEKVDDRVFNGTRMKYMGTFPGYVKAVYASFSFFCHLRPKLDEDTWRTVKVALKGDKQYRYRLYMKVK